MTTTTTTTTTSHPGASVSDITVIDLAGARHVFASAHHVELAGDGAILVVGTPNPRTVVGAFATGQWRAWIRNPDQPAPAHKTHVHFNGRAIDQP